MDIRKSRLGSFPLLKISGDIDHASGSQLVAAGQEQVEGAGAVLLLDLANSQYMDSGGVSAIFSLLTHLGDSGRLVVIGANPNILRILEVVGLPGSSNLQLYENACDATTAQLAERL